MVTIAVDKAGFDTLVMAHLSKPNTLWLDSNSMHDNYGRYSFLMADPIIETECLALNETLINGQIMSRPYLSILDQITSQISPQALESMNHCLAGYIGYEMGALFEGIAHQNSLEWPLAKLNLYPWVAKFDHFTGKGQISISGVIVDSLDKLQISHCSARQAQRAQSLTKIVSNSPEAILKKPFNGMPATKIKTSWQQSTTKLKYIDHVNYILQALNRGDFFEINYAQHFSAELEQSVSAEQIYLKMRSQSPVPFGTFFNCGDDAILSRSPERFLKVSDGTISVRPIKGSAPRGKSENEDEANKSLLSNCHKSQAENIMTVDLMRNDLAKVAQPKTVTVSELMAVETFANVHHLTSTVEAKLKKDLSFSEQLQALLPGGSITGAPKVSVMSTINELEPVSRGPYCGSIGYFAGSHCQDWNILIRTLLKQGDSLHIHAGGAIVLDSNPEQEYEETLFKLKNIFSCFKEA